LVLHNTGRGGWIGFGYGNTTVLKTRIDSFLLDSRVIERIERLMAMEEYFHAILELREFFSMQ
jgi:hypothetical protein